MNGHIVVDVVVGLGWWGQVGKVSENVVVSVVGEVDEDGIEKTKKEEQDLKKTTEEKEVKKVRCDEGGGFEKTPWR